MWGRFSVSRVENCTCPSPELHADDTAAGLASSAAAAAVVAAAVVAGLSQLSHLRQHLLC